MTKTKREDLVYEIKNGIITYLKQGIINSEILTKKIINPEIGKIDDFDKILRIHFLLQDNVINFISELDKEVRTIKKRTITTHNLKRNQIKGQILWHKTLLLRSTKYIRDNSIFICNEPKIDFNMLENLVLKKILHHLYTIFKNDLKSYEKSNYDYNWFSKWKDKSDLVHSFFKIYENNIYLNKIHKIEKIQIKTKDLYKVLRSRNQLYKNAAKILIEINKILNHTFDAEYISDLLTSTLIIPEKTSTLFELFCLFKIIFQIQNSFDIKFKILDKDVKEFAIFENDKFIINVFHDSKGNLDFSEKIKDISISEVKRDSFLGRVINSINDYKSFYEFLMGTHSLSYLYRGRPDLIIEIWQKEKSKLKLKKVFIGEIKYTEKPSTFTKGLKELIEYINFASYKDNFLISNKMKVSGILIVDGLKFIDNRECKNVNYDIQIFDSNSIDNFKLNLT